MENRKLNKQQEATITKLKDDLIPHIIQDNGETYLTLAHKIRVRIDSEGNIVDAWVDKWV